MKSVFIVFCILLLNYSHSQTNLCNGAQPFCTGTTYNFPAPTGGTSQSGIDYGCLGGTPNPTWFYLKILNGGNIDLNIAGANTSDDIDFACWGPFSSATGGCVNQLTNTCTNSFTGCTDNTLPSPFGTSYPAGNLVDCSYDIQSAENCHITNASPGQYYLVLITNFGGNSTNIIFTQTNANQPGAGETDCGIICGINATATPSACDPATNQFSLSGAITFTDAPLTGTLTVTSSCGGSQTFNAPFTSPINYSINSLLASGGNCSLSAVFSDDAGCSTTVSYTEPTACNTSVCSISQLTATPSACNTVTNTYGVTGTINFSNPPNTGTLTISGSCGGSQVFNAPFVGPLNYSLSSLPSNGNSCTVNAVFSADNTCVSSTNYTAPVSCNVNACIISQLTVVASSCNASDNTYSVTGVVDFNNPPVTGTLTLTGSCGGTQTFNAPFSGPLNYSFTNLQSNGVSCSVTAAFSADNTCTSSTNYTAPNQCNSSACNVTISSNSPVCEGEKLELFADATNGSVYNWTGPNGYTSTTQNPVVTPALLTNEGAYTVNVTLTNSLTCSANLNVDILDAPVTDFDIVYSAQGLDDFKISTTNNSSGYDNHYWLLNSDTVRSLDVVDYDFFQSGVYEVCLINNNNQGCESVKCKKAVLKGISGIYVPNTFTPDKNQINDFFKVYGLELEKFEINIYDKWGKRLFNSVDDNISWDGTYEGEPCKSDVYIWQIKYTESVTYKQKKIFGHINLIR